jgi:hypothetical protein
LLDQRTAEDDRVNEDRGLGAMPKLYGAPAYARPVVVPVAPVDRPHDPDDLPLEAEREPEAPELVGQLEPRPYEAVETAESLSTPDDASVKLSGRPFRLRIPGRSSNGR